MPGAVFAETVDVQFRLHAGLQQRVVEQRRLGGGHDAVLVGVDQECRRRGVVDADVRRRVFVGLAAPQDAVRHGVHGNEEVGPAGSALHRIVGLVVTRIPTGADRDAKMASGGESKHAYPIRRDAELGRPMAYKAHRPQPVEQRYVRVIALAEAIAQHERRDAPAVEPTRHLESLVVRSELAVAPARIDDDAGTRCDVRFGKVNRQLRTVQLEIADRLGRTLRPKFDGRIVQRVSQWSSLPRRREPSGP